MPLDLFISHKSTDKDIAEALIELLRAALSMPAASIRCSSVDGYRLEAGARSEDKLREELTHSQAFVGLITPASIQSAYVLFELGARWGAGLHLIPLLARGADTSLLKGPLSGLNALQCSSRAQVLQVVNDVGRATARTVEQPAVYDKYVEELIKSSKPWVERQGFSQMLEGTLPNPSAFDMQGRKRILQHYINHLLGERGFSNWDINWDIPEDPNDNTMGFGVDGSMDYDTSKDIYRIATRFGILINIWTT